jgi:hypothetical protein
MHSDAVRSDEHPQTRGNSWWIRAFLLFGALEAIAIGASGFLAPTGSAFARFLPLAVAPLNGRVIGAFYLAGAIGLLASALGRRAIDTRIFVAGFGFIAGSLLIVTLAYWDEMTVVRTPIGWIASYVIDPLAALAILMVYRLWKPARPGRHRLSALYGVAALLLGAAGLLLLVAPNTVAEHWPWNISVVLARVYAMFFLGFGLGAALAAGERDIDARRPITLSMSGLGVLVVLASLQHRDRFADGLGTWLWFGAFVAAALAFGISFVLFDIRRVPDGAAATTPDAALRPAE